MLWLALWWCVSLDPVAEMDVIRQGRAESTGGCDWGQGAVVRGTGTPMRSISLREVLGR